MKIADIFVPAETAHSLFDRAETETLALGYNIRLPGAPLVTETHDDEEEFYIIYKGTGRLFLGGEEAIVHAGQAVYVPRNTEHGMTAEGDETLAYLFVANWPK